MKAHNLKLDSRYFDDVKSGIKSFEIRKNDRNYRRGDLLVLHRFSNGEYVKTVSFKDDAQDSDSQQFWTSYDEETSQSNADYVVAVITYITNYAQKKNYVVLGIKLLDLSDKH